MPAQAVSPGTPAQRAGFQPGDRIVAVDGGAIELYTELQTYVALRPDQPMHFSVERGGRTLQIDATPLLHVERDHFGNEARIGRLGVTQSGGSRYESGRTMPKPVRELLRLVHIEGIALDRARGEDFEVVSYLKKANPKLYTNLRKAATGRTATTAGRAAKRR